MRLFTIEGNIGAGKSTLLQQLREIKTVGSRPLVFVPEPVESWKEVVDADGKHILELFYADQFKYAFAFQMLAFISRYALLEDAVKANPTAVILTERCLFTDYCVFASMLHETGCMSEVEYSIYKKWFDRFNTTPLSGIIYLKCRPEKALARCKSRNRPGEAVDLAYLTLCDEKHQWIEQEDAPLLTLNADEEMSADLMEEWVDAVCLFLEEETHVPPYWGPLAYCSWTISLLLLPLLFYGQARFYEWVA